MRQLILFAPEEIKMQEHLFLRKLRNSDAIELQLGESPTIDDIVKIAKVIQAEKSTPSGKAIQVGPQSLNAAKNT